MVHLMARHSSCPIEDGVSLRTGFLLTSATGLFSPPSPCRHVPAVPLPEASVWVLKGTLKFSCICHRLYLFLMTFLDHLRSPFSASPESENTATIWRPVSPYPLALVWSQRGQLGTGNPLTARSSCTCTGSTFQRLHTSYCIFFPPTMPVFRAFLTQNIEIF